MIYSQYSNFKVIHLSKQEERQNTSRSRLFLKIWCHASFQCLSNLLLKVNNVGGLTILSVSPFQSSMEHWLKKFALHVLWACSCCLSIFLSQSKVSPLFLNLNKESTVMGTNPFMILQIFIISPQRHLYNNKCRLKFLSWFSYVWYLIFLISLVSFHWIF